MKTVLLLLLIAGGSACAGTAQDPTQPSPKWIASPTGTQSKDAAEAPMETQVIVSSPERKITVIDGVMVRVGETYNGDRLVDVRRTESVWKRSQKREPDTPRPAIVKKKVEDGEKQ